MAAGDRLWRRLPDVRERERSRFLFFASLATLISLAQTLGLAGSEALYLAAFGAASLPTAFIAAALATVLCSMVYASVVGSVRNDTLFSGMLVLAGVLLAGATAAVASGVQVVLPALFCFFYVTQAIFVNHLWTFAGDYFDSVASKRLLPLFTVGSSLGGLLGGVLAAGVTRFVSPLSLVAVWALLFLGAALQIRLRRRHLRRWGPLDLEEADETSVQGIQGAVRYLRASSLGRWLILSAAGMMLALFLAQYLYSEIFVQRFPSASGLAMFFGVYLALTNLIEIALELRVTPWLIRRFGVATANLVHPVVTLLSFGALAFHHGLASGIAARMNRELLDNAVSQPVRALVYNAMPMRFRGRVRAFLEGIVVYAGMAVAGGLLLVIGDPDPRWLAAAGLAAAAFYFVANLGARRAYVDALVRQLRTDRLDLDDVGDEIGSWEAARLAELWEELLRAESRSPSRSLLQLIPELAERGLTAPLVRGTAHPSPTVRRACITALVGSRDPESETCFVRALADTDAGVRLAALEALASAPGNEARLAALAGDPDPAVRAAAALHAGPESLASLREMIASREVPEATAALRVAPAELVGAAAGRMGDPEPEIRAAALECIGRVTTDPAPFGTEVLAALADPSPRVRGAAVPIVADLDTGKARAGLASALADASPEVQSAAETGLAGLGEEGIEAARPYLRADRERTCVSALRAVAATLDPEARRVLHGELRYRVRNNWQHLVGYQLLPPGDGPVLRFLRVAFEDEMLRSLRIAFRILELLQDRSTIRKVEKALRSIYHHSRGDALEVLSNLGDREAADLLVLLYETGSLTDRARRAGRFVPLPRDTDEVLAAARHSHARWIRMAANAVDTVPGRNPEEEWLMERLLALRQVPLFSNLSLEQLEAVQRITTEEDYTSGEVIVREGDPGGTLYLLISGVVHVYKDYGTLEERLLGTQAAGSYFGEMATLDDEPRSATCVAAKRARLLCLDGDSLKALITQMPELSFEIFRVLTARVRNAEERLKRVAGRKGP